MLKSVGVLSLVLLPTLIYFGRGETVPPPSADPLDQRQLDYIEDGAGRTVADIEARLFGDRLELVIAPVGPRIEPLPGYTGRAGANELAALELQRIVEEELLQVLTRGPDGSVTQGHVRLSAWDTLPVRRLRADGSVDFLARSRRSFPVELRCLCPLGGPGRYETRLFVRGEARLRVRVLLDASGAQIEELEALGAAPGKEVL